MTRKDLQSAFDRFLGSSSSESILRDLRSSIDRTRAAQLTPRRVVSGPIREFVDTLTRRKTTNAVLRRLRVAVARAGRMR